MEKVDALLSSDVLPYEFRAENGHLPPEEGPLGGSCLCCLPRTTNGAYWEDTGGLPRIDINGRVIRVTLGHMLEWCEGGTAVLTTRERADSALAESLSKTAGVRVSSQGYVTDLTDNLFSSVTCACLEPYKDGAGKELDEKMRAAHSSSALVVNAFCPWLQDTESLAIGCNAGFTSIEFEKRCPTGLKGYPPHLDVFAQASGAVLGIESKCTEYLIPHVLDVGPSYNGLLAGSPQLDAAVRSARTYPYVHLNVSQLVKHSLGLSHSYPSEHKTLVYLFWEPRNWTDFAEFSAHRAEVRRYSAAVSGGSVRFIAMTYRQLWDMWALQPGPTWLADHVDALVKRYDVSI